MAANTTLIQQVTPIASLPQVLAARNALLNLAVPLGAVAAGPLITTAGARSVILFSAVATVTLGLLAGVGGAVRRRPPAAPPPVPLEVASTP